MSGLRLLRMAFGGHAEGSPLTCHSAWNLAISSVPLGLFSHLHIADALSGCGEAGKQLTAKGTGSRGWVKERRGPGWILSRLGGPQPWDSKHEVPSVIHVAGKLT